jgi:RNA polymerase sigma-70 factor (ECF subfamily)
MNSSRINSAEDRDERSCPDQNLVSSPDVSLLDSVNFTKFYESTYRNVFRFIYGYYGGSTQEAEDMTADTYFRAWKARHRFHGSQEAAFGWLLKIARNLVIDEVRRRKARGEKKEIEDVAFDLQLANPGVGPEEATVRKEQEMRLWSLIYQLTPEQREMILLRYMLDWPVFRIADHMGLMENTVSVTIRRSLQRLRIAWNISDNEANTF